jgi:Flp pilus assembly protein TadD
LHNIMSGKFFPFTRSMGMVQLLLVIVCLAGCSTLPVEQRGDSAKLALAAAAQVLESGDLEQAHGLLTPLLAQDDPGIRLDAMHMLTRIYTITGDTLRQRDMASAILAINAADPQALEVLGLLALAEGHAVAAEEYLLEAIQTDPIRWAAWNGLGIVADMQSRYAQAAVHFQRGLEIVPNHPTLLANLGWSKILAGDAAAGELLLRLSLETAPDSLVTRSNLAFSIALQGRYEEARTIYTQMYDPSIAANNIGYAAKVRRDRERAGIYLREAITLKPSFYAKASNNLQMALDP